MYESLKPTPVSVTTPITMPTVAAAAPTASAYLAPVSNASTRSLFAIRDFAAIDRCTSQTTGSIARNT